LSWNEDDWEIHEEQKEQRDIGSTSRLSRLFSEAVLLAICKMRILNMKNKNEFIIIAEP